MMQFLLVSDETIKVNYILGSIVVFISYEAWQCCLSNKPSCHPTPNTSTLLGFYPVFFFCPRIADRLVVCALKSRTALSVSALLASIGLLFQAYICACGRYPFTKAKQIAMLHLFTTL